MRTKINKYIKDFIFLFVALLLPGLINKKDSIITDVLIAFLILIILEIIYNNIIKLIEKLKKNKVK